MRHDNEKDEDRIDTAFRTLRVTETKLARWARRQTTSSVFIMIAGAFGVLATMGGEVYAVAYGPFPHQHNITTAVLYLSLANISGGVILYGIATRIVLMRLALRQSFIGLEGLEQTRQTLFVIAANKSKEAGEPTSLVLADALANSASRLKLIDAVLKELSKDAAD